MNFESHGSVTAALQMSRRRMQIKGSAEYSRLKYCGAVATKTISAGSQIVQLHKSPHDEEICDC